MKFFQPAVLLLCIAAACRASDHTMPYILPLTPAANDTLTFQRTARSVMLDMIQVEVNLAPCAIRLAHWHAAADEFLLVVSGKLGFTHVEANNTYVTNTIGEGNVLELPKGGLHGVWNPTCQNTVYTNIFNAANPVTYNLAYALPLMGNFTTDGTYLETPALRYPGIVRTVGQWVYNPDCLDACDITLPPNLMDASVAATGSMQG